MKAHSPRQSPKAWTKQPPKPAPEAAPDPLAGVTVRAGVDHPGPRRAPALRAHPLAAGD
jgi:hypothetical protein